MNKEDKVKRLEEAQAEMVKLHAEMTALSEELEADGVAQPLAVAKFVLYNNGGVDIIVDWDKNIVNQENMGVCIGNLLDSITNGGLNQNIYQALLTGSQQNLEYKTLVESAIKEWGNLIRMTKNSSVVHPSSVFGVTKIQGGDYDNEIVSDDIE